MKRIKSRVTILLAGATLIMVATANADDLSPREDCKQKDNCEKLEPAPPGPVCDYVPRIEIAPAKACGFNDASVPNPGKYRCGNTIIGGSCRDNCIFVECE